MSKHSQPLLFGHCVSAMQVSSGKTSSTESPEGFHQRCPGALFSPIDAHLVLRCECRCHRDAPEPTPPELAPTTTKGNRRRSKKRQRAVRSPVPA